MQADFGWHNGDGMPCDASGTVRTYPDGRPFTHGNYCPECERARHEAIMGPTPEWVRRAQSGTLVAKDLTR